MCCLLRFLIPFFAVFACSLFEMPIWTEKKNKYLKVFFMRKTFFVTDSLSFKSCMSVRLDIVLLLVLCIVDEQNVKTLHVFTCKIRNNWL